MVYTYFIQEGTNVIGQGIIKIGCSTDPLKRLVELRHQTGRQLYLLFTTPLSSERWCHERFSRYRIAGSEWFWPGDELVSQLTNNFRLEMMHAQGRRFDDSAIDTSIEPQVAPEWAAHEFRGWKEYLERRAAKERRRGELASSP